MTRLLCVDTSNGRCSVALSKDNEVLAYQLNNDTPKQAEQLVPMMEQVLDEAATSYTDLDALVSTIGPGSFTGIRIGMSVINAIALAHTLPTLGLSTLEVLAHSAVQQCSPDHTIVAILNAYRGQCYMQRFSHDNDPLNEPGLLAYEDIATALDSHDVVISNCPELLTAISPDINILEEAWPDARLAASRHILALITEIARKRLPHFTSALRMQKPSPELFCNARNTASFLSRHTETVCHPQRCIPYWPGME